MWPYGALNGLIYAVYLTLIVGGGLIAVLSSSLVRALLGLILAMMGISGMYFLLNCFFIGLMQILIYVGAVSILIFFAIMLTRAPAGAEEKMHRRPIQFLAALCGAGFPTALIFILLYGHLHRTFVEIPEPVPIRVVGRELLGSYGLAFELISVVLLAVMIGAVLLSFERKRG